MTTVETHSIFTLYIRLRPREDAERGLLLLWRRLLLRLLRIDMRDGRADTMQWEGMRLGMTQGCRHEGGSACEQRRHVERGRRLLQSGLRLRRHDVVATDRWPEVGDGRGGGVLRILMPKELHVSCRGD